ncbi:sugar phosphate isomerase/epimerase [Sesbania bispinosa]|nr:sugar phosphate isomerase/epimerase [Sesbania bispinosa]
MPNLKRRNRRLTRGNRRSAGRLLQKGPTLKGERDNEFPVLGKISVWGLQSAVLPEFFKYSVKELAAISEMKANMEKLTIKLREDEAKMQTALARTTILTEANAKIEALEECLHKEKATTLAKKEKLEADMKEVEDGWDKLIDLYFHTAIEQIKFSNPSIAINTNGMDTMCVARNGKWYRVLGDGWYEIEPGDEEPVAPKEKYLVIVPTPVVAPLNEVSAADPEPTTDVTETA